jgi:ATP-dependent Clp protease ATP-binding subunit ClpA
MTEREQPETPLRDVLSKLANFAQDLTAEAERGTLAPGARRTDIERIQHVLCRHVRNYPVLLAQPDVDVRGVVEGLAWEIAHIPSPLVGKRVIALDGKSISEALSDTERGP